MSRAIGPDISFYQDDNTTPQGVDFDKMKAAPSDFVIIRAGQCSWVDPDFATNWAAAKAAGLPRGSYWYYDSRCSPESQAHIWASALGDDLGEVALFADFEENYGGPWSGWHNFYKFLEELKEIVNKEILIYTGYYYWKDNVSDVAPAASVEYFKQYDLWIARYSESEPWVPEPWADWAFWQYTAVGDGPAYGVESKGIDLNYFNGTPEEFRARFGIGEVEPPPIDPPPTGDDMLELLERIAVAAERIADVAEDGTVTLPPIDPPDDPVSEYPKHWQLINPKANGNVPFFRNPDVNDNKVLVWKDNVVNEFLPPEKYYDDAADLFNLLKDWAWIPACPVNNANGYSRMMPKDFETTTGKPTDNWFGGAFVERKHLQAA